MAASDAGPAAVSADALWTGRQSEAIADALLRELGRLARAVDMLDLDTRNRAALALADAQALRGRVHALRRHLEQLGAGDMSTGLDGTIEIILRALDGDGEAMEDVVRSWPAWESNRSAILKGVLRRRPDFRPHWEGLVATLDADRDADAAAIPTRPTIQVRPALNAMTREALDAIRAMPDLQVYVRARMLVTVARDGSDREQWLTRLPAAR